MTEIVKPKHAKLSPSGSSQWMNCPGSINLCRTVPEKDGGSYAGEGTAAHELAEKCLLGNVAASSFLGQAFEGFEVTKEMASAVQVYIDAANEASRNLAIDQNHSGSFYPIETFVEEKFHLDFVHKDIYGTSDCVLFAPHSKKLEVWDYKHGAGVVVEPEDNTQLMIYALGAAYSVWKKRGGNGEITDIIEDVSIVIAQPRIEHEGGVIRTWDVTMRKLLFWASHVLRPAAIATENKHAPLRVSPKACQWCDAIAVCPEQRKQALAISGNAFNEDSLPNPQDLKIADIVKILEHSAMLSKWAKEATAYAQGMLERGDVIPGYKLVAKRSNRKWANESMALKSMYQLVGDEAINQKVLSVAQMEKVLKKKKISTDAAFQGLVVKPFTGTTIAHESDRRAPVQLVMPSIKESAVIDDMFSNDDFLS